MADEQESRFVIEGQDYPIPGFDTFDIDEAQILYDNSGLTLEDFVIDDEDAEEVAELERKLRNPGFIRTLLHVAYQRGNPGLTAAKVKQITGRTNLLQAWENFLEGMVDDENPPEPQRSRLKPQEGQSEPDSSNSPSGEDSTNGSAQLDETHEPTGTTRSATSSPPSTPAT